MLGWRESTQFWANQNGISSGNSGEEEVYNAQIFFLIQGSGAPNFNAIDLTQQFYNMKLILWLFGNKYFIITWGFYIASKGPRTLAKTLLKCLIRNFLVGTQLRLHRQNMS